MGFFNMPDGSFYDPDGYFFDKAGIDEFGGHYDSDNNYIPGDANKHLFNDMYSDSSDSLDDAINKDDLLQQFDDGYYDQEDEEDGDHKQNKMYKDF